MAALKIQESILKKKYAKVQKAKKRLVKKISKSRNGKHFALAIRRTLKMPTHTQTIVEISLVQIGEMGPPDTATVQSHRFQRLLCIWVIITDA